MLCSMSPSISREDLNDMKTIIIAIVLCFLMGNAFAQAAANWEVRKMPGGRCDLCASTQNPRLAHTLRALTTRDIAPKRSGTDSGKRRNVKGKR
jgi:hypothetical protein